MKINHIGRVHVNPYIHTQDKLEKVQQSTKRDKLEISSEALQLSKGNQLETERQDKVKELKQKVQSGDYEINAKETARKLYDFWNQK